MEQDIAEVVRTIEIWMTQRVEVFKRNPYNDGASMSSMTEFANIQNGLARRLISLFERQDPQFWEALIEVASMCEPVIRGGKVFVNKQDVTGRADGRNI